MSNGDRSTTFESRLERVRQLSCVLGGQKDKIVAAAVRNLCFTIRDSAKEVDMTVHRLGMFEEAASFLNGRAPLGGPNSTVALMLSYNGSAWLNVAITSIYLVGNKVRVKFSSKGADIMVLTEAMYRPIFGDDITFFQGGGRQFIQESLADPEVSCVVVFGFDENVLPYASAFRQSGKKLVFEGPGQDPFIVLPDANIEAALADLMEAKFMFSGQTCNAPKRIFIHRSIYPSFIEEFVTRVKRLAVGDPRDARTDVSPLASYLAVSRIKRQLEDAVSKGATIIAGGDILGNLVYPAVVGDASDDMLGMKDEVFGPVAFTTSFETREELIRRVKNHKYGLRASVFGGDEATRVAEALHGELYCHPVADYVFGKFGTVAVNQSRAESWRGAFVTRPVGGYGYSGWIWETVDGVFRMKQGPKLLSLESSVGPSTSP